MAQGLSEVLDTDIDTSKMDFRQLELDKTKNQAMYPVFQQTFLTTRKGRSLDRTPIVLVSSLVPTITC